MFVFWGCCVGSGWFVRVGWGCRVVLGCSGVGR